MKRYITTDPQNSRHVKDADIRPNLPSTLELNTHWKNDYLTKTGVVIKEPKIQGLSRNHRISDHDIKINIIDDINHSFTEDRIHYLIERFPWAEGQNDEDQNDKEMAKSLLKQLKNLNQPEIVKLANALYLLFSAHVNNISYGNASQNSAIGKHLDLNAPLDHTGQHSLTPRSRKIVVEHHANPGKVLLSSPKEPTKKNSNDPDVFLSSQYGLGGSMHKEEKNIHFGRTSPRTRHLLSIFNPQINQTNPAAAAASPTNVPSITATQKATPVKITEAELCIWFDHLFLRKPHMFSFYQKNGSAMETYDAGNKPSKSDDSRYSWIDHYF